MGDSILMSQKEQKFTFRKCIHFLICMCNRFTFLDLNCHFHFISRSMDEIYDILAKHLLPTAAVASNPNSK